MRSLLILFLKVLKFFRHLFLRFRGIKQEDLYAERVVSGKSWEEFCDQLKAAGGVLMYPGTPHDPFQQAEGLRYLTRLTRGGLEAFVEYSDPAFPVLKRMVHETVKMGADNPDNYYFNAQISGKYEYRITGKRNSVHYIGFFTQNGNYGTTGNLSPCAKLEHKDLDLNPDGSFEIILSKTNKGRNWLKMVDDTSLLIVRQTFSDRLKETPAELHIENLDGRNAPDPLTPARIDEGLKTASLFVAGAPLLFAKWAKGFQAHTNQLPLFDPETSNQAGGDPDIYYYHSHWKLSPDEVLIIDVKPPSCDSWNFQLDNYWMESLDYRYFNVCINKASAVSNSDGSITILVAHQDPAVPNWIETAGHHEGTMCWRWYRLNEGEKPETPSCRVVKFNELESLSNHLK
jgi:hypothetical protein